MLADVATGDREAFAGIYDDAVSLVLHEAYATIRCWAIAEEVAQEVMLEVWRTASRFDRDRGTAVTWLLVITRRRSIDRIRSEESHRRRNQSAWADDDRCGGRDEVALVDADLDRSDVWAALSVLTPLQRQAISLAYRDGHTYTEVAALLGIPLSTAKTRIRDGLHRLRLALSLSPQLLWD